MAGAAAESGRRPRAKAFSDAARMQGGRAATAAQGFTAEDGHLRGYEDE